MAYQSNQQYTPQNMVGSGLNFDQNFGPTNGQQILAARPQQTLAAAQATALTMLAERQPEHDRQVYTSTGPDYNREAYIEALKRKNNTSTDDRRNDVTIYQRDNDPSSAGYTTIGMNLHENQ